MSIESRPSMQRQAAFNTDRELEVEPEGVERTLVEHGIELDLRQPNSRIDRPTSDEFVDDRIEMDQSDAGGQGSLFSSDDDQQMTLEGETAAARFMFD